MTERFEPSLGEASALPGEAATSRAAAAVVGKRQPLVRRWRWWVAAALVALTLLAFALLHWRNAIAIRLVTPPQQNRLMQQAAVALHAGRLSSPDGRGARQLYEAALARDPDDLSAREGLVRVANAALAQAQAAIDADKPDLARRDLDLARDLSAPVAAVARVEADLRRKSGGEAALANLLGKAAAAASDGHLDDGQGSALAIYQQAIALAPDNALVLDRRARLLSRMLAGEDALLASGDLEGAGKLLDRVAAVDPGHLDLPNARTKLATATQRRQRERDRQLDRADADLRAGRIDAAVASWRQVLAQAPDEQRAHTGLREAADAWVGQARRDLAGLRLPQAQAMLDKAREAAPDDPAVHALAQRLQQVRVQRSGLSRDPHAKARLATLVASADAAMARGDLVEPPGDSAFDLLHQAAAIAPTDPRVIAANRRFVATVAACIPRALTDNRLARASDCFDALAAVHPGYPTLPSLRSALAKRWLDYADERIGAGELGVASRAVDAAHRLTPADPAVAAMAQRIRIARGGR